MGVRMNNFIKKGKMGARMTKTCKKRENGSQNEQIEDKGRKWELK